MTDEFNSQNPESDDPFWQVFDALVECGWDVTQFVGEQRRRADRVIALLNLLHQYPVDPVDEQELIGATMRRIDQFEQCKRRPVFGGASVDGERGRWCLGGFNWQSALTAAAAILILVSITVPMLANVRRTAVQRACLAGIGNVALGLSNYANAYDNSLPIHIVSAPGGNWLDSRANSSNLFRLAKTGFATFEDLACPGNPATQPAGLLADMDNWPSSESTSFSYQNVLTGQRPQWNTSPAMVILADKSPVVEASRNRRQVSIDALSPSHRSGQNALLSDGSGMWLNSAQFGNDNIWVPDTCQSESTLLVGNEMPGCASDSMLIH